MASKQRAEQRRAEFRRQRDEEELQCRVGVIAEFNTGDPEATMHALAARTGGPGGPAGFETAISFSPVA
jgi:hypothetical protein